MIFGSEKANGKAAADGKHAKAVEPEQTEEYEGIHPGGQKATAPSARHGNNVAFFIVQRDGEGAPKTFNCQTEQEAQIFLETLLTQGVSADGIDLYRASRADFNVNFKPIVDLK